MVCSSLTIDRTRDMDLVKRLWGNPCIYYDMRDDSCPVNPADWHPADSEKRYFLVPQIDFVPIGIVAFYALSHVICEIHIGLLPEFQHLFTSDIVKAAINWMFNNTSCKKIIAFIPVSKPNVYSLAIKCDFEKEGYLKASFSSNGTLTDQYIMSIGSQKYVGFIRR